MPRSNLNLLDRYLQKWRFFLTDFLNLRCLCCEEKSLSPLCLSCTNVQESFSARCQTCLHHTAFSVCLDCQKNPPALNLLVVRWRYQEQVRIWIQRAKYSADRVALQILTEEAERLAKTLPADCVDAIFPMPIPKRRLAERGFNQTLFLARGVAKITKKPILKGVLLRHYRPQQVKMNDPHARQQNIKNAFYLSAPPPQRVLLVDDVYTTGATLSEAVKTLKAAGAAWVGALVIAGR